MKWNEFVKWATENGWFADYPRNASRVVMSSDIAIGVDFFWVGWDNEGDKYTRSVRIFKSRRQASKFARKMAKKMGAKFEIINECSNVIYLNGKLLYLDPQGTFQSRSLASLDYIIYEFLNEPEIKMQINNARSHSICNAFTILADMYDDYIEGMLEIGYGIYGVPDIGKKYLSDMYEVLTTSPEIKPFIVLG